MLRRRPALPALLERATAAVTKPPAMPKVIFHYTSADGLQGILGSTSLRASNARYLNDSKEIVYALEVVRSVLQRYGGQSLRANQRALIDHLVQQVEDFDSSVDAFYSTCFCGHPDVLGQWRGYGGMGSGYSIGFRTADLQRAAEAHKGRLIKVVYEKAEQRAIVQRLCQIGCDSVIRLRGLNLDNRIKKVGMTIVVRLFNLLCAFKHKAFQNEQEWRLVFNPSDDVIQKQLSFIDMGGWLKPYLTLNLGGKRAARLPISSITCGPSLNSDLSVAAVRLLLSRHKYESKYIRRATPRIRIAVSDVPFRLGR
jgi:hypothetical protein